MPELIDYQTEAAVGAELANPRLMPINENAFLANRHMQAHKYEQYQNGRTRKRGKFNTTDLDSFTRYVEENEAAEHVRIFINQDAMSAVAILNFDADSYAQGHLDHKAELNAQPTATFKKLLDMHSQGRCNQKRFAEFLEDWGHQVTAKDAAGKTIDNAKAVNAIRHMRIDEHVQTDSKVGNYSESRSTLASVEAKSIDENIPAYFEVLDECFKDIPARLLKLRLGISQDEGKPVFKLEIVGLQVVLDALAKDFAVIVAGEFNNAIEVLIGSFAG